MENLFLQLFIMYVSMLGGTHVYTLEDDAFLSYRVGSADPSQLFSPSQCGVWGLKVLNFALNNKVEALVRLGIFDPEPSCWPNINVF